MKKEDLQTGMIVRLRNGKQGMIFRNVETEYDMNDDIIKFNIGFTSFKEMWNKDLTHINDIYEDIVAVYVNKTWGREINELIQYSKINLRWERRTIDWNKIPQDTKVQVSDNGSNWFNRYWDRYDEEETTFPYKAQSCDSFVRETGEKSISGWSLCRVHPSVKIKEEWYK